jgi:hypothetical protein
MEYRILSSIVHTFFKGNCEEILPVQHTRKAPEKGFKIRNVMAKMVAKLMCALYSYAHYTQMRTILNKIWCFDWRFKNT